MSSNNFGKEHSIFQSFSKTSTYCTFQSSQAQALKFLIEISNAWPLASQLHQELLPAVTGSPCLACVFFFSASRWLKEERAYTVHAWVIKFGILIRFVTSEPVTDSTLLYSMQLEFRRLFWSWIKNDSGRLCRKHGGLLKTVQ